MNPLSEDVRFLTRRALWETENLIANSREKLKKKNLDMVAANDVKVAGAGFGVDTNVITLITHGGAEPLPKMTKRAAADAILDRVRALLNR